jgi:hypothetical protein
MLLFALNPRPYHSHFGCVSQANQGHSTARILYVWAVFRRITPLRWSDLSQDLMAEGKDRLRISRIV